VDEKRGIAYYPIGSPTYDYDGADRQGKNLFGNCILALDARTGKRLWHFQTVHHDLWDYDLTSAPQLITVKHNGKNIDAVAVASKNGFLYVLDRVNGKPLWPIEERPVPKSQMPNEKSWPTQPFPTVVPPFNRQVVTADDVNPYFKPEDKEKWINRVKAAKSGLYEPLSDKYETIGMPGSVGGANYGNTAANPAEGIVYIQSQELPVFYKLKLRPVRTAALSGDRLAKAQALYTQTCQACHGADKNGLPGVGTSLLNLNSTVSADNFKQVLNNGKGRMPAIPHLDDATIAELYAYLAPTRGGNNRPGNGFGQNTGDAKLPDGPVVASGGVTVPPMAPRKQVG
jgi:quinoprotein glucose dehydrogenase